MGVYWAFANHDRKEIIYPPSPSYKWPDLLDHKDFMRLCLVAMKDKWDSEKCGMVHDLHMGGPWETYTDITQDIIDQGIDKYPLHFVKFENKDK